MLHLACLYHCSLQRGRKVRCSTRIAVRAPLQAVPAFTCFAVCHVAVATIETCLLRFRYRGSGISVKGDVEKQRRNLLDNALCCLLVPFQPELRTLLLASYQLQANRPQAVWYCKVVQCSYHSGYLKGLARDSRLLLDGIEYPLRAQQRSTVLSAQSTAEG